jgi:hypothetical protein
LDILEIKIAYIYKYLPNSCVPAVANADEGIAACVRNFPGVPWQP